MSMVFVQNAWLVIILHWEVQMIVRNVVQLRGLKKVHHPVKHVLDARHVLEQLVIVMVVMRVMDTQVEHVHHVQVENIPQEEQMLVLHVMSTVKHVIQKQDIV